MINKQLKNITHKIGLDKSIAYSSGARIVQGVTGVGSVFFISTFLTGVEQGFYYTFGSILALQVFFELGLTGIMTQYVAHEVSHLTLKADLQYEGEEKYISRLASLIHFCIKWYAALSIFTLVFLSIVGYVYFTRYGSVHSSVSWKLPWLLICIGTAIKLFQSPFASIYMGLGKVKEMSKIGFLQQIIIPATTWTGLICGLKLYVVGIGYILSVILWQIYVRQTKLDVIILNLWKVNVIERVAYFKEIFPYQWRIALSWVSGYFIFQLFNPVLFATEGAIVAGQMGMTLQALNAIQSLAMNWQTTKIPLYSSLIAKKDYMNLDLIFNKTLKQMLFVCLLLLLFFSLTLLLIDIYQFKIGHSILSERFLNWGPLFFLVIPVVVRMFIFSWATYLRCHKQEPYLAYSVVGGVLNCASILILGKMYGLYGIVISSCILSILLSPWGYFVYKDKKKEWHGKVF